MEASADRGRRRRRLALAACVYAVLVGLYLMTLHASGRAREARALAEVERLMAKERQALGVAERLDALRAALAEAEQRLGRRYAGAPEQQPTWRDWIESSDPARGVSVVELNESEPVQERFGGVTVREVTLSARGSACRLLDFAESLLVEVPDAGLLSLGLERQVGGEHTAELNLRTLGSPE